MSSSFGRVVVVLSSSLCLALAPRGLAAQTLRFEPVSPQGFGDRHNTKAWAMAWWKDRLYVGTARVHLCLSRAALSFASRGLVPFPPRDAELACTEDMRDLPLRGEIWRYAPGGTWELVFRSPLVAVPGAPERTTARDAGFRNLVAFTEADGTEALYALGITSESIHPGMPPPRILRTTDGASWEPVPQEPGTLLGDLGRRQASFRAAAALDGRLYVVNGDLLGAGAILESEEPARGGDAFRVVSPHDMSVFELAAYRGGLYAGVVDARGYAVLRADGETGVGPHQFLPMIEAGGHVRRQRARGVTSMHVYDERLYVGTDRPGELVRVNPDGTWDLVVGRPRATTDGWKEPLSGLGPGFDYGWANHLHRIADHDGRLFVAVNDAAGLLLSVPGKGRLAALRDFAGFDLFTSEDGVDFSVTTLTGFGDPRENVIRVFASTPHGLFAGTANPWRGLRVYRGEADPGPAPEAPTQASAERVRGGVGLTWEGVPNASRYRIYRRRVRESPLFEELGSTTETLYVDVPPRRGTYHYFVRAEDGAGESSPPSNLARFPSLRRSATLARVEQALRRWSSGRALSLLSAAAAARRALRAGDLESGRRWLETSRRRLRDRGELAPWREADAERLLTRALQRLRLVEAGLLSREALAARAR